MKKCSKCGVDKELTDFYKKKSVRDGHRSECKGCTKEYSELNRTRITKYKRSHYIKIKNTESFKKYRKKWHEDTKEQRATKSKEYNKNHKKEISLNKKQYYTDNKEVILEDRKRYYEKNKESIPKRSQSYLKEWRSKNKKRLSENIKLKKKNDPLYKLSSSIRTLIWNSITKMGYTKSSRTSEILGCPYEKFKLHIESLFKERMSWENYGDWHFDHKIPISWAKTEEEVYNLNHYTNFQPSWANDNLIKGNRWCD